MTVPSGPSSPKIPGGSRLVLMVVISILLIGCNGSGDRISNNPAGVQTEIPEIDAIDLTGRKLKIVATTDIIGDVAANVAGDAGDVTVLMPHGTNPHSYNPLPRDVVLLEGSDIILVNGLGLEESLLPILANLHGPYIVPVSAGIEPGDHELSGSDGHVGEESEDNHFTGDPHFWWSPVNVISWTDTIAGVFSAADPKSREVYRRNADLYIGLLQNLHSETRASVDTIPPQNRKLVMDHEVIGYYAREYGFEVPGYLIPSFSDQSEPSARQVAALSELVHREDVKALFVGVEAGGGVDRLAESVASGEGKAIPVVRLLTGSLARKGNRGDSYVDFIRYNTELIVSALSGD